MRKHSIVLAISILMVFTIFLSGCVIIPLEKRYEYNAENVSSIDVYDLHEAPDRSNVKFEEIEPIYTLDESEHEDFLSDLAEIEYTDYIIIALAAIDPSFEYGEWTVKITFTDGTYRLLSCGGYGEEFDENGDRIKGNHYSCEDEEWDAFVENLFPRKQLPIRVNLHDPA